MFQSGRFCAIRNLPLIIVMSSLGLTACGGGSSGGSGGIGAPAPSGSIVVETTSGFVLATTPISPYTVNIGGGIGGGPFTATEQGFAATFTIVTACNSASSCPAGPCLEPDSGSAGTGPDTTTIPSGGVSTFQAGLLCVRDGHVESATVTDGLGHSNIQYFSVT